MKKLLLLASILLTTLSGFSQQDTSQTLQTLPPLNNLEKDSLVCLPKTLMLYMVRDLIYFDQCKQEVEYYATLAAKYSAFIENQDKVIELIRKKEVNCQNSLAASLEVRDSLELQTTTLKKELRTKTRAKRFWLSTTIAAAAAGAFIYYKWKEE